MIIKIIELIANTFVPVACVFLTYWYQDRRNKSHLIFEKQITIYTTISKGLFSFVSDLICFTGKIKINDNDIIRIKERTNNFIQVIIIKEVFVYSFLYSDNSRKSLNLIKDKVLKFQKELLYTQQPFDYLKIKNFTKKFLDDYIKLVMQFLGQIAVDLDLQKGKKCQLLLTQEQKILQ